MILGKWLSIWLSTPPARVADAALHEDALHIVHIRYGFMGYRISPLLVCFPCVDTLKNVIRCKNLITFVKVHGCQFSSQIMCALEAPEPSADSVRSSFTSSFLSFCQ